MGLKYEDMMAGKGSKRRQEDLKAINDNWADINWGSKDKAPKKKKGGKKPNE